MKLADGFGNYLYIIMAVVYVAYSIIKAGKKVTKDRPTIDRKPGGQPTVQPPTASPVPKRDQGDELKKMLEELLGGGSEETVPDEEVVVARPQPIPERPKQAKPVLQAQTRIRQSEKPKEASAAPAFHAHPEIVQKVFSEQPLEEETTVDFDVRQAVLYSEILKRPQY